VAGSLCLATIQNAPGAVHTQEFPDIRICLVCGVEWPDARDFFVTGGMSGHFCRGPRQMKGLRTADSSSPVIAVMQPAHALLANHGTPFQRACPASRRLLVQPEVGSVVVIIGDVLREEALQMSLIQRDHVVEQVTAAASDPTLGDTILPGTLNRGTDRCHLQRADRRWHFPAVLRIVVQ
jgi:hypothetical protein